MWQPQCHMIPYPSYPMTYHLVSLKTHTKIEAYGLGFSTWKLVDVAGGMDLAHWHQRLPTNHLASIVGNPRQNCVYYTYVCIYKYICMYVCMCVYIYVYYIYMYVCIRMYVYVCMYTYVCIRMYVYVCMYTYVCIRMILYVFPTTS